MKIVLTQDFENWRTGYVLDLSEGVCKKLIDQNAANAAHPDCPAMKMKPGEYEQWLLQYSEAQKKEKEHETLSIQQDISKRRSDLRARRGSTIQRRNGPRI